MENGQVNFVLLRHKREGQADHYDLMFDLEPPKGLLRTFSIFESLESIKRPGQVVCKQIFDHERRFLDYEGSVNNGAGNVVQIDKGLADILSETPFRFRLAGAIVKGDFVMNGEGYLVHVDVN
ncbi:MAG: hypothetical protein ACIAQZ_07100 [Sedimentisphaeraceae bacterium JB056]